MGDHLYTTCPGTLTPSFTFKLTIAQGDDKNYVPSTGKVWKDLVQWFGRRRHLGSGQRDRQTEYMDKSDQYSPVLKAGLIMKFNLMQ